MQPASEAPAEPRNGVIAAFAAHPVAANLAMVMMIMAGIWGIQNITTSLDPPMSFPAVFVDVEWQGASAEDIERLVTVPIEQAVRSLPRLQEVRSRSYPGGTSIMVLFEFDADRGETLDRTKQAIAQIRNFPEDIEPPRVSPAHDIEPLVTMLVTGGADLEELAPRVRELEQSLRRAGIERIDFEGLPEEELAILVPAHTLAEMNTTLDAIAREVQRQSSDVPAGSVGTGHSARQLRSMDQQRTAEGFGALSIEHNGELVHLGHIAQVERRPREDQVQITRNGEPGIELHLRRRTETDTFLATRLFYNWLEETRRELPEGVVIHVYHEVWKLIADQLDLLLRNGLSGLVLVIATLFLFLGPRTGAWVTLGIPVSFLLALAVYYGVFGGGINIITLLAFIMALGIVVDDAIVVGEDAATHFENGAKPLDAAIAGARRMFVPVLTASLTTLAAFLPLILVGGPMGQAILAIPTVMLCVIIASFVECFLVLPAHLRSSLAGWQAPSPTSIRGRFEAGFRTFRDVHFRRALQIALDRPAATVACAIACVSLAMSLAVSQRVGINLATSMDTESLSAQIEFSVQAGAADREHFINDVEAAMQATAAEFGPVNITAHSVRMNTAEFSTEDKLGAQYASIEAEYAWAEHRTVSPQEFVSRWRELTPVPHFVDRFELAVDGGAGGGEPSITLALRGDDILGLKAAAEELAAALRAQPGVSNVSDDLPWGREQVIFSLTPAGRSLGLTSATLGAQLRAAYSGSRVQIFNEAGAELEVKVLLPDHERDDLAALYQFPIQTPNGQTVPLGNVAELATRRGIDQIRHSQGQQSIRVFADVDPAENNAIALTTFAREEVPPALANRYDIEYGLSGRSLQDELVLNVMKVGGMLTLLLIYLILTWVFASWLWPLAIMTAIPFGLTGAIFGHWAMGMDIGSMSLLAFFSLTGIVVNDSIVLITFFKRELAAGVSPRDAIETAAIARFRAVILTSLTTIAGLAPLMIEPSSLAMFIAPIAVTLCWGLAFATSLILLVIPCLILLLEDARNLFSRQFTTARPAAPASPSGVSS